MHGHEPANLQLGRLLAPLAVNRNTCWSAVPGGRAAITEEGRKNVNADADADEEVFGKHGHGSGSGGSRDYLLEGDMYCLCAPMMVTVDCVHVE